MFNKVFDTDTPYKYGGYWGPFNEVKYTGMGRLGRLRGLGEGETFDVGDGLLCSGETASFDSMGNALDINGNRITCNTSNIGVKCEFGICTDLESGESFPDPVALVGAAALAAIVGVVNPLTAGIAAVAGWMMFNPKKGPKPLTQGG